MTKVAIMPEPDQSGEVTYRAIAGRQQSTGKTAGEALDALASALPPDKAPTLVIVQHQSPDRFFTAEQQSRLGELMSRWRFARDSGATLSSGDQAELDALVEAEVRAAGERTREMLQELQR
jgi:hypothetical protein